MSTITEKNLNTVNNSNVEEEETMLHTCDRCGKEFDLSELTELNDEFFCESCLKAEFVPCENCGEFIPRDEAAFVGEEAYCESCADDLFTRCACCGEYIFEDDAIETEDGDICESCVICYYTQCDHCEAYVQTRNINNAMFPNGSGVNVCDDCLRNNEATCDECGDDFFDPNGDMSRDGFNTLCDACFEAEDSGAGVCNYSYKPNPIFMPEYSKDTVYYGIELETDRSGYHHDSLDNAANRVTNVLDYTYVKHDGSLNDGMEIVTHPATLEYHTVTMKDNWLKAFDIVKEYDLTSHDAKTCGLHVHVSLNAIESRDPTIVGKLLFVIEKYWDEIVIFTRRTEAQLNKWAKRYAVGRLSEEKLLCLKNMAKSEFDRYMALNLQNSNTIEFRVFRGTLNWTTFVATLQFVQTIIENLTNASYRELQAMTWNDLVRSDFEELNTYLRIRNLYDVEEQKEETIQESFEGFRKGDWVKVENGDCPAIGHVGRIVSTALDALVEFEEKNIALHNGTFQFASGTGWLGDGHYWYCDNEDLVVICRDEQ